MRFGEFCIIRGYVGLQCLSIALCRFQAGRFAAAIGVASIVAPVMASALVADVTAKDGTVTGWDAFGHAVWQRSALAPTQLDARSDGRFSINGTELIDRYGRSMARLPTRGQAGSQLPPVRTAASLVAWGAPATISNEAYSYVGPAFDDAGNAWVVVDDANAEVAEVVRYDATSASWQVQATVPELFALYAAITVDASGDVVLAGYGTTSSGYVLETMRYQPSGGWSSPIDLWTGNASSVPPITTVSLAADAKNNIILMADLTAYGAATFVYTVASSSWSGPQPIPLPIAAGDGSTRFLYEPALVESVNRKYIQFSYVLTDPTTSTSSALGLYTSAFNAQTLSWKSPVRLSNTQNRVGYYQNYGDRVLSAVDNQGGATILWSTQASVINGAGSFSNHRTHSRWGKSVQVSATAFYLGADDGVAFDAAGDMLVSLQVAGDTSYSSALLVLQYSTASGSWSQNTAATWGGTLETSTAVAWYGSAGEAVAVFLEAPLSESDPTALTTAYYDSSAWSSTFPVPPGNLTSFLQTLTSGPTGQVLLVFDPATSSFPISYVYASFIGAQSM